MPGVDYASRAIPVSVRVVPGITLSIASVPVSDRTSKSDPDRNARFSLRTRGETERSDYQTDQKKLFPVHNLTLSKH